MNEVGRKRAEQRLKEGSKKKRGYEQDESRTHTHTHIWMITARTPGFVSLSGNLSRNLPEFSAMAGNLEKEKDHRGNVGNMPGK